MDLPKNFPFPIDDDILFWSRQLGEHALFVSVGLDIETVPDLKMEGKKLYEIWMNVLKLLPEMTTEEKIYIVKPLIDATEDYQVRIAKIIKTGKWIGFDFLALIEHHLDELYYYRGKVLGIPITTEAEYLFWKDLNQDHIAAEQKLIDPKEESATAKALDFVSKYRSIKDIPPSIIDNENMTNELLFMIDLTLKFSKELDEFNLDTRDKMKTGDIITVIHPLLIDHIIREEKRSLVALELLAEFIDSQL